MTKEVNYPALLSNEKEKEVYTRWLNGEKSAKEELIQHTLGSLAEIAKNYASDTNSVDDLIQVGAVGLIKALEKEETERSIQKIMLETAENEIKKYLNK